MKRNEGMLLTVGELAKKVGVTVRTLQYYDTNGLLVPTGYSEGGRRMYGRHDIIRLHQILFLKSFGFSLEEIRDRLLPTDSAKELEQIFNQQKIALEAQISNIQEAVKQLDKVLEEVGSGSEIDIERLFAVMGATRIGSPYASMIHHFSKEQIGNFFTSFESDAEAEEFNKKIQMLNEELIELYRQGKDPEGSEGQRLAAEWWGLVMALTKGDPTLIQNMFAVGADQNNWPSDIPDLKEAIMTFLTRALSTYFKNNGISVDFSEVGKNV